MATRRQILEAVWESRKINLIKMFREASGQGLKESKDAIESVTDSFGYNEDKILELFAPYLPELRANKRAKEKLLNGIQIAMENAEALGFSNVCDAVRMVVDNFQ